MGHWSLSLLLRSANINSCQIYNRLQNNIAISRQFPSLTRPGHQPAASHHGHSQSRGLFSSMSPATCTLIPKQTSFQRRAFCAKNVAGAEPLKAGVVHEPMEHNVQVREDGKWLTINELADLHGETPRANATWLRHNCHCDLCKQEHSGQRLLEPSDLRPTYTLASAALGEEILTLTWNEEEHEGKVPLQFLINNTYSNRQIESMVLEKMPSVVQGDELPAVTMDDVFQSDEGLFRWLHYLNEYGISLVTSVPTDDGMVRKVAEKICPIQHTIYGEVFDVVSTPKPINVAYSSARLGFHMDLVYYESPPGLQFLHCIRFDECVEGGDSVFVDSWYEAERLRSQYPHHFAVLTRVPATFQKIHFDREAPVYMRYQRPHIMLSPNGTIVAVNWAPPFEGPLSAPQEDVEPYYEAYHTFANMLENSKSKLRMKLWPGDLISFNNRRILHARDGFELNGGVRHLQGCYVNIDEFKSRVEVLAQRSNSQQITKRVFNNCWS